MVRLILATVMLLGGCCTSGDPKQSELVEAAQSGDLEKAQDLLKNGASIESRANDDWTPLTVAAREGRLSFVSYLIGKGANINATEGGGNTALFWAAYGGHLDVVKLLVEKGADTKIKCGKCLAPVVIAKQRGHEAVASYLESVK